MLNRLDQLFPTPMIFCFGNPPYPFCLFPDEFDDGIKSNNIINAPGLGNLLKSVISAISIITPVYPGQVSYTYNL